MTRFFLPIYRKVCLGLVSLAFLASPALAQSTVTVIGPIVPGDCAVFNSTTVIKDSGSTGCGGTPGGSNGQVQFNNAGNFGGLTNAQLTALVQQFSSTLPGAVPASGGGTTNFLRADGTWASGAAGVASFNGLTGAVTTNVVVQKFLTTGTYTPTSGMLHAIVECIGSGGGGGGVTGSSGGIFIGAGGESGSYSMKRIAATDIVGTATVTIGALGSGGAAGNNSGSAGSDVTVVSNSVTLCAGKGGAGGGFTNTTTVGRGGASAVSGTGDVTAIGSPGDGSFYNSANLTSVAPSGRGGASALGGGGTSNFCAGGTTAAGAAAGNYGSGGAGACVSNGTGTAAGGNGSAGIVIITEFVNM